MKQHVIAQTYQGGFLDPNTPSAYEPYVWVYFRDKKNWKAKAPINFAWVTDLYTLFHPDGTRDDVVEKLLSTYEGKFATAMRKDIRQQPLSDDDRTGVAGFIALLLIRPPRFLRDFLPRIFADETTLRALASKVPRFADGLKKTFRNPDPRDIASWFSALTVNEQKLVNITMLIPAVEKTAAKLYDLSWAFVVTPPDEPLISSDTPISFTNVSGRTAPLNLQQIDDPNVEIAMPMSSHVALILYHGRPRSQVAAPASAGAASDLNSRVLWQSQGFVFTCQKSFPGDNQIEVWANRTPIDDVARVHLLVERLRT